MRYTELTDRLPSLTNPAGGFTEFNPNEPHPYPTYYHLKLYNHPDFEGMVPNRSATVKWLRDRINEGFVSVESDKSTILDLYHGTESLRLLDALGDLTVREYANEETPPQEHIQQVIKNPNAKTEQQVGQVFRLLTVYDALDVTYDVVEPIETWLTQMWSKYAPNVSTETLPEIDRVYKSLRLVGYMHDEITAVADPTDEIAGLAFPARLGGNPRKMFALRSCHELRKQFSEDQVLSERVLREVASMQNKDGGFSAAGAPVSDCKGTYIATKLLLESDAASLIDLSDVRRFASRHALNSGGFSLNHRRSPNLYSTYLVCRGLNETHESPGRLVQEATPLPRDPFADETPTPKELYQLLYVRNFDGTESPGIDVNQYVHEQATQLSDGLTDERIPLEDAHFLTQLAEEFTSAKCQDDVSEVLCEVPRQFRNSDGGFGTEDISTAQATYYGTRTLSRWCNDRLDGTGKLVRANRTDDGGFAKYYVESGGSDVVSTYYSVMTLEALDESVENPEKMVSWLEDTRHPDGGWAYDPQDRLGRGPTLRYTVLAQELLGQFHDGYTTVEPAQE